MFDWKYYSQYLKDDRTEEAIEKCKTDWKQLTPEQLLTVDVDDVSSLAYSWCEPIAEVITKEQLDALIKNFNNKVENNPNNDDIYLPELFSDVLFEEIEDEESIEDIEKEWVNHDLIYKDKFDRYFSYHYDGNFNWRNSGTIDEVEPYTETITVTKYRSKK